MLTTASIRTTNVPVSSIIPSVNNPRLSLTEIEELAGSITAYGLIQPLTVEESGEGFHLIAGHRRLEAVKAIGWTDVPVHIVSKDDTHEATYHLIENVARVDLSPVETAQAVHAALKRKMKQKELAKAVGRSEAWVSKFKTIAKALPSPIPESLLNMTDADKLYAWATRGDDKNSPEPTQEEIDASQSAESAKTKLCEMIAAKYGLPVDSVKIKNAKDGTIDVTLSFAKAETLEEFAAED